jgi:hypothetical protein
VFTKACDRKSEPRDFTFSSWTTIVFGASGTTTKTSELLLSTRKESWVRNREEVLTRDLALYLYDQGVTAIYRPQFGRHEFDLLQLDAKQPMFIEVKVYKDSGAKGNLIRGVAQLHGYLSSYEAHKNITEAYYVIFRIGGPIYDFPRKVETNRFTIYPTLIDLSSSDESGSNQPRPTIISLEELAESIRQEVSTSSQATDSA